MKRNKRQLLTTFTFQDHQTVFLFLIKRFDVQGLTDIFLQSNLTHPTLKS